MHSHLYRSPDMLVSTFQRVDLPIIPVLDQYQYILYTDADVFFRRRVTLDSFGGWVCSMSVGVCVLGVRGGKS